MVVAINLLPWRDKQTHYEKKQLQKIILSTIAACIMTLIAVDRLLDYHLRTVQNHIEALKKEWLWRVGLLNKNNQLSTKAPLLEFFRRLNEADTLHVCFEQIKKNNETIELMGIVDSAQQLTRFLQSSSLAAYFSEIKITRLRQQGAHQLQFHLTGK